ncbi:helix-turn-helix transcriptional regulator [Streptomyces olivoreticuli]
MSDVEDKELAPTENLGNFIRQAREGLDIPLIRLAADLRMHQSYLSRLERGDFKQPSPEVLQRLAIALKVRHEDLFALAGYLAPDLLPSFMPYMRAKYAMSEQAAEQINAYFTVFRHRYGIEERADRARACDKSLEDPDEMDDGWPPPEEFTAV